jgi:hypothetical protein
MKGWRSRAWAGAALVLLMTCIACVRLPSAVRERVPGLTAEQVATLSSLAQVDDYPLYTMRYRGSYRGRAAAELGGTIKLGARPAWACSLFAALGDPEAMFYGRNFDWEYSPALLLFADPPDAYASVSMVDIAYLGFGGSEAGGVAALPLPQRESLLRAPWMPFDGMNEHGLAVGMAAVPPGDMSPDPTKANIDSLGVIREILDRARDVDEAVAILDRYNVVMGGGPPLHYLIADRTGRAVLVEFYQGKRVLLPNVGPWHLATNFLRASAGESAAGQCTRYDRIEQRLAGSGGRLSAPEAMDLLGQVAQEGTQWSVVYGLSALEVRVAMGHAYEDVHTFQLESAR